MPPLRTPSAQLQVVLDARRIVRWVYVGRLAVASAILIAAVFVWDRADAAETLAATLIFVTATAATVASAVYSEIYRRPLGGGFLYLQTLFDLLLVTAVVHVTGGSASQFAALYILVVACAALLLPRGGGLLIALAGCALYFADVFVGHGTAINPAILLQLLVFGGVALGSGYVSARLQEEGAGSRQLAAELVRARLQAADILQNIRSGVVTLDARGYLLFANPAAGALLGADLEDRVGAPVLADLQRVAPGLARALSRALAAQLRTTRAEAVVDLADRAFTIGVTTTFSKGDGTPEGMTATAIFSDISDQKRLESLHLRAERLEAVAELSASLAHEIKNPLASIRSAVEQLARMHAARAATQPGSQPGAQPGAQPAAQPSMAGADEDAATLSALIVRESDRLSRLLSEFLDFARVRVTKIERVDLGTIVLEATNLAAAHPDKKEGVQVTCATPPEPLVIEGDEDLLHRAAFNLALNAVQAAPPCGRVTIEAAALHPDQLPSGIAFDHGAVVLRVTDNGPGIAPEARERLFTPFFTTKVGGTGLGLSVVHRAIEAHRGVVFVDTGAGIGGAGGVGTRFTVVLPRAQGGGSDGGGDGDGGPPPTT